MRRHHSLPLVFTVWAIISLGCDGKDSGPKGSKSDVPAKSSDGDTDKINPKIDTGLEQRDLEAANQRRDELRKHKAEDDKKRADAETAYQKAKSELEAARRLKLFRSLAKSNEAEARIQFQKLVSGFAGTVAASDAQSLLDGKEPPARTVPTDPDEVKAIQAERFLQLTRCVDLAAIGDWGSPLSQIPATVIDVGVLKHVPYQSFRAGSYEFNVYGDPEHPVCLEIGIDKTLFHSALAKDRCMKFVASLLPDAGDRCLVKSLKLTKDLQKRGGVTFEITPETAADAWGSWWVSVYNPVALDKARASAQELASITIQNDASSTTGNNPQNSSWSSGELAQARPGGKSVYVHGYTRKDGTYVQSHTRSLPGSGSSRRR